MNYPVVVQLCFQTQAEYEKFFLTWLHLKEDAKEHVVLHLRGNNVIDVDMEINERPR